MESIAQSDQRTEPASLHADVPVEAAAPATARYRPSQIDYHRQDIDETRLSQGEIKNHFWVFEGICGDAAPSLVHNLAMLRELFLIALAAIEILRCRPIRYCGCGLPTWFARYKRVQLGDEIRYFAG
jgi:hypothetical protein